LKCELDMTTYTLELINSIKKGETSFSVDELIDFAARNKILLHFLRSLDLSGEIRDREERRYTLFLKSLEEVKNILNRSNYDYAFFKLNRPVYYVPADIDIIVSTKHVVKVASEFIRHSFRFEVCEPFTITLTRGSIIVDLYTYPSLGNVVYLDGQRLLKYKKQVEIEGLEIISLEEFVEAIVALSHAIDKEWLYTLNDYFTVSSWFNRKSLDLCYELGCVYEAQLAFQFNGLIEKGLVEAPIKLSNGYKSIIWSRKLIRNHETRATLLRSLSWFKDPRFGKSLFSKFTRETY